MDKQDVAGYIVQDVLDNGLCDTGLKISKNLLQSSNDLIILNEANEKISYQLKEEGQWILYDFVKPISSLKFDKKTFSNKQIKNKYYVHINNCKYIIQNHELLIEQKFSKELFKNLPYRFYSPINKSNKSLPLVIFLHGSGERGKDNVLQLIGNKGAITFTKQEFQKENPCFVLAPQAPLKDVLNHCWVEDHMPNRIKELIDNLMMQYNIDSKRIYLVGMSNGGSGVWKMIYDYPDFFAGAIVMCGIVDTESLNFKLGQKNLGTLNKTNINRLKNTAIYICHDVEDDLIDCQNSIDIYNRLKENKNCLLKLTKGYKHACWIDILNDKEILTWLFEQRLNRNS